MVFLFSPTNDPALEKSELKPGDILGTTSLPLLRAPLEFLGIHDSPHDVSTVVESDAASVRPATPTQALYPTPLTNPLPVSYLGSLTTNAYRSFASGTLIPSHIQCIDFALDATGWDATAIDAFSSTLTDFAAVFSSSKLDYGGCSLRPSKLMFLLGHSR